MAPVLFRLVSKPNPNFDALCGLVYEATGVKISEFADKHSVKLSEDLKFATCLESFSQAPHLDAFSPFIRSHLHFTGALACDQYFTVPVVSLCSELACLHRPTKARGVDMILMSGNLNQWLAAVTSGRNHPDSEMKQIFLEIEATFKTHGYSNAFTKQTRGLIK